MQNINGQNYYNAKDIAGKLNVSITSIHRLIQNYIGHIKNNIIYTKGEGDYRRSRYISEEGLAILLNMKDSNRGNQFSINPSVNENEKNYKKHIAKEVIQQNKPPQQIVTGGLSDTVRALLAVVELAERNQSDIRELQGDVAMLKGDTANFPIRKGQKDILNERVRALAIRSQQPYHNIWNKLHEQVGRRSINEYVFEDYQLAINIINGWIKKFNFDI